MVAPAKLTFQVYGHGRLQTYGDISCPDLTYAKVSPGGDVTAAVNVPFVQRMELPLADTFVDIVDEDLGLVWSGFSGPLDPPDLSNCNGPITIGALGWGSSFTKRLGAPTTYGPRWDGSVIGQTIEDAVINAVTQTAPNVFLYDENVDRSGVTLDATENFQGQTGADVLASMSARTQHLATPALWHVRQRNFSWKFMDLAPRYRVRLADGAKVKPRYDPSRAYNRVLVAWGKNQVVEAPKVLSYTQRQQIVDLYLNAGAEVRDQPTAQALADGVYARMQTLRPEWSFEVQVPVSCPVEEIVDGAWTEIKACSVEPGYVLWIPDLDPGSFGPDLDVPQGGFMTRVSWANKVGTLSVSIGEPRSSGSLARLARRITAAGVSPLNLVYGNFSRPNRSTPGLLGPNLTSAVKPSEPPPVDYPTPAASTKYKTILPEVTPPQPPGFGYQINNADSTGAKGIIPVEPCVLEKYSLFATKACTVVLKISRVSDGAAIIPAAMFVGAVALPGTPAGRVGRLELIINPEISITKPDHLQVEVTTADDALVQGEDFCTITFRSRRYYPGYPGNQAPKTGKQF